MAIISKLKRNWHRFWRNYNRELLESCLDEELSSKLQRKVAYHELKLSA